MSLITPLIDENPSDVRLTPDALYDANLGTSAAQRLEPAVPHTLSILVVDDIAMNRDIAGSFLRAAGHAVVDVGGGMEAVAAVAAEDFDVVLMDVRMPGVDGPEATRRIRALEGPRRHVPIVALTAQIFSEQVMECRDAGMDGHVGKPFTPESLLAAVLLAIAARQTRAAIDSAAPEIRPTNASVTGDNRSVSTSFNETPAVSGGDTDLALSILDHGAYQRTVAILSPKTVADCLQIIVERCEALLRELDDTDALGHAQGTFAETAHSLAGSAGMFGFGQLSAVAHRFAGAIQAGADDVSCISQRLRTATRDALQEIQILNTR